jgi:hypothetical protein
MKQFRTHAQATSCGSFCVCKSLKKNCQRFVRIVCENTLISPIFANKILRLSGREKLKGTISDVGIQTILRKQKIICNSDVNLRNRGMAIKKHDIIYNKNEKSYSYCSNSFKKKGVHV